MLHRTPRRVATTTLECAVVYPVAFFLVLALIVGAMGILRYQEMATLSREAARYAAVHGTQYAKDTGNAAPTPDQIYQDVVVAKAVGLDTNSLSATFTYNQSNAPTHILV